MPDEEGSPRVTSSCTTCHRLKICAIFYLILYLFDILSDLVLSWHYFVKSQYEDSVTTFIFVFLPFIATILVNYLEENLKVDDSRGCLHYFGFLPPRSKWKKFTLHRKTHETQDDEAARVHLEQLNKNEEINAVILQDISACFESAPQLIFQLSIVFRDMATFDGNLQASINLTNAFKLFSIFSSTFSIVSALYLKIENKDRQDREKFLKERRLGLMGIFSRVSFLLGYSSMCVVSPLGIVCLAYVHWVSMVIWLICSRHAGYNGSTRTTPLATLEALLHVFQYTTWSPGRDPHNTLASLAIANFVEWIILLAGLIFVFVAPTQKPEFIMFKVGFATHFFIFFTAFVFLIRYYYQTKRVTATS